MGHDLASVSWQQEDRQQTLSIYPSDEIDAGSKSKIADVGSAKREDEKNVLYRIGGNSRAPTQSVYNVAIPAPVASPRSTAARFLFLVLTVRKADTNEIVSILGHELGHWKMSHTLQGFVISQTYLLASFCAFGLATELGESLRLSFGYSTSATLITLYLFFAVVSAVFRKKQGPDDFLSRDAV